MESNDKRENSNMLFFFVTLVLIHKWYVPTYPRRTSVIKGTDKLLKRADVLCFYGIGVGFIFD